VFLGRRCGYDIQLLSDCRKTELIYTKARQTLDNIAGANCRNDRFGARSCFARLALLNN
jgi:hypothetical protein